MSFLESTWMTTMGNATHLPGPLGTQTKAHKTPFNLLPIGNPKLPPTSFSPLKFQATGYQIFL